MMPAPRTLVHVRRARPAEADRLAALAALTFRETFAADNDPLDMTAYMAQAFSPGGDAVGYAMLRDGVGSALMRARLAEAAARHRETIWLGVSERNARAIDFYRRWGFADVGSHDVQLGRDRRVDRVMCRRVPAAG